MSELRRDPFTQDWVAIAPGRRERPQQIPTPAGSAVRRPPAADPACPFCPGREEATPPELWRLPASGDASSASWRLRVVPNRYPVLAPAARPARHHTTGLHTSAEGIGSHEVVIESPAHDWDLPDGDDAAVADVLRAYRARCLALRDRRPGLVLPFRNHGAAAGTSLPHPHSQIVATPIVPARFRRLFDVARAYYDDHGSCLYVDHTVAELADGERVIATSGHVAALVPYAARTPYETWLVPRHHQASFADAPDEDLEQTAVLLRRTLGALRDLLGDVPYNYAVISAPNGEETTAYFAWHLQIAPRLTEPAGFELGTGITVNPVPPEQAAAHLRQALAAQPAPPAPQTTAPWTSHRSQAWERPVGRQP
ncbi:galactose-1-phosphate uridylyltransferase [Streptomyces sp. NPDC001410]|uniref:galactose-1-phosphate uridylyltransferase n=1 Tax=Streptomyces sp. NPDC001410 TaxID=3364574 RepID=UPI00367D81D0